MVASYNLITVNSMLTLSSPGCAMGPSIGIQLPEVRHQTIVLRSVKSFKTGKDYASVRQTLKGSVRIPTKSFKVLELHLYNA